MAAFARAESVIAPPRREEHIARSAWSGKRIPELDGVRGLAILLVLIWHLGYLSNSAGSHHFFYYLKDSALLFWSGVDLFFVLSGFLIGGILLDARASANYFKTFYIRRVCRIVPVYAVLVLAFYACMAVGLPKHLPGSIWLFGPGAPWYELATFTQNIHDATSSSNTTNTAMWLSVTWSLAIEEQFYLVLPAIIFFVPRSKLAYVVAAGILAAPLLRLFLNLKYVHGLSASFNLMPCRADALLSGVACALLVRNRTSWELLNSHRKMVFSIWVALLLGLPAFVIFKQADAVQSFWMSTVGFSLLAAFYAAFLLLAITESRGWFGKVLRNSWLKLLGAISYCLYLIHEPVLGLTFAVFRRKEPWATNAGEHMLVLLALIIALGVAWISWIFFEKPFLRLGHAVKY